MTTNEEWLNIYDYDNAFIFGSDLYPSPTRATKDLADKKHYMHSINVRTGEIVKVKLKQEHKE